MNTILTITGTLVWLVFLVMLVGKFIEALKSRQKLSLNNQWVVVTGCDSGIGLGVLKSLVAENVSVIAFTFTEEGAAQALKEGAKLAPRLDITDEVAVKNAVMQIKEISGGKLWGVAHNAGAVLPGFIEYQVMDTYRRIMHINFFAVARLTQALIPMLKPTHGRVVIVSSVDGIVSLPGNAPYDASKFAVEAFADALRVELSFWDVKVAVVNPSTMRTPLALGFFDLHHKAWQLMEKQDPAGLWKEAWTKEWLDEYVKVNSKNLAGIAQDPIHAINDVVHAVTAKHPRFRYLSGTFAKTLFYALWKMPEEWSFAVKKGTVTPTPKIVK